MTILSIMISGFLHLYNKQTSYSIYNEIQSAENNFLSNPNASSVYETINIKLIRKTVP